MEGKSAATGAWGNFYTAKMGRRSANRRKLVNEAIDDR
jgi:hypothetical protein